VKERAPNPVPVSALHKTNITALKQELIRYLEGFVEASFSLKINDESMSLVSQLFDHAHVQNIEYEGDMVNVVFRAIPWFADRVKGRVEKLGGMLRSEAKSEGETSKVAKSCCSEMGT